MIQDMMMSSRLCMCFPLKDLCANMQTNDMKKDTGDSNLETSICVLLLQQFVCGVLNHTFT